MKYVKTNKIIDVWDKNYKLLYIYYGLYMNFYII